MLRNFSTEADIRKYIPNLDRLLFTGKTDWDAERQAAELEVQNDFQNAEYQPLDLRDDLSLRTTGTVLSATTTGLISDADYYSRNTWIINVTTFTGSVAKTITLQGTDDGTTWTTLATFSVTATGIQKAVVGAFYSNYRVVSTVTEGTVDYESFLSESVYNLLYEYAWVKNVFLSLIKADDDQYSIKYRIYLARYTDLWKSLKVKSDVPFEASEIGLVISRG